LTGFGRAHADSVIARIARSQFGIATCSQLIAGGLTAREIRRRAESGHLIRLHQGVYAVGHAALHPLAPSMAAVLACGKGRRSATPARPRSTA